MAGAPIFNTLRRFSSAINLGRLAATRTGTTATGSITMIATILGAIRGNVIAVTVIVTAELITLKS